MTLPSPISQGNPQLHDAVDAAIAAVEAEGGTFGPPPGSYMRGPKLPQRRRRSKTRRDRSRAKRKKR